MIAIKSKKEGFRRCGIAHPSAETTYPDNRFTKAELAALKAEPMLVVKTAEDKLAEDLADLADALPLTGEEGSNGEGEPAGSITKPKGKGKK